MRATTDGMTLPLRERLTATMVDSGVRFPEPDPRDVLARVSDALIAEIEAFLAERKLRVVPEEATHLMVASGSHWEHHAPAKSGPTNASLMRAWPHMLSAAPSNSSQLKGEKDA